MQMTIDTNPKDLSKTITLNITDSDIVRANIQPFDWLLFRDVASSNSIADQLLALEVLARRIEQSKHD